MPLELTPTRPPTTGQPQQRDRDQEATKPLSKTRPPAEKDQPPQPKTKRPHRNSTVEERQPPTKLPAEPRETTMTAPSSHRRTPRPPYLQTGRAAGTELTQQTDHPDVERWRHDASDCGG